MTGEATVTIPPDATVEQIIAMWKALRPNQRAIVKVMILARLGMEQEKLVLYQDTLDIKQLIADNAQACEVAYRLLKALG